MIIGVSRNRYAYCWIRKRFIFVAVVLTRFMNPINKRNIDFHALVYGSVRWFLRGFGNILGIVILYGRSFLQIRSRLLSFHIISAVFFYLKNSDMSCLSDDQH